MFGLDTLNGTFSGMLKIARDELKDGSGTALQGFGLAIILLSFLARVLSSVNQPILAFAINDYLISLGLGLLLVVGGTALKIYETQVALQQTNSVLQIAVGREQAAADRADTGGENAAPDRLL
jgi:hypothetical protein